jgi:hypothetical protein
VGHEPGRARRLEDVYAQLEQRADRSHGTSFDALLRRAGGQRDDADWATFGPRTPKIEPNALPPSNEKAPQTAALYRHF